MTNTKERTTHCQESRILRIGIMGTPASSRNQGVVALRDALVLLCLEANAQVHVSLFGSHRDSVPIPMRPRGAPTEVPIIHWRLSLESSWRNHLFAIFVMSVVYWLLPFAKVQQWISNAVPWIHALEETDFVGDIRGGDSFSDIYGMWRFFLATMPVISVLAVKRGMVQFPQTYGPFKSRLARFIAGFVLRRSTVIMARDRQSQKVAQELVGPHHTVVLCPDVAFALHVDAPVGGSPSHSLDCKNAAGAIGVNVNGLMFSGGYTGDNMFNLVMDYPAFVRDLVVELLAQTSGDILLIPHTYAPAGDRESDNTACRALRDQLPPDLAARVHLIEREYDAHELKAIIGQCDFFVGSRMHSCIAALSQGIPCVGVAYSMKFLGVFDSVGAGDCVVDGRTTENAKAVQLVVEKYLSRHERRAALQARALASKKELQKAFSELFQEMVPGDRGASRDVEQVLVRQSELN